MANLFRGEVPFRAGGRELYVRYGTREIAEVQAALGFQRADPFLKDEVEDVDVPVFERVDSKRRPKLDAAGLQEFRRERILVDADVRQARMVAAFEAVLLNPDPAAAVTFFRVGLRPWQREAGVKFTEDQVLELVDELGLVSLKTLHAKALSFGSYLKGTQDQEEESGEGKAQAAAASST